MNVFKYALAQAERQEMSDAEAAEAIAAARLLEKPRKIPKPGVSIFWHVDGDEQGEARLGAAWQGMAWHGKARAPMAQEMTNAVR